MPQEDLFIYENRNLIYSIAANFKNYPNKEDLFQVGAMGLIKAYRKYDPSMNVKLTTYAYPYILGEMKKLVREDKSIKISREIFKLSLLIERTIVLLTQKWMREPTIEELSDYLNIPETYLVQAMKSNYKTCSMDEPIRDEGKDMTLSDVIPSGQKDNLDDLILLRQQLSCLTPLERRLIENRYFSDMTQSETAKKLGMSQVQVSRKENKILTKMRSGLAI